MSVTLPQVSNRIRLLLILYGVVLFVWLGMEDQSIVPVVIMGFLSALVLIIVGVLGQYGGQVVSRTNLIVVLALIGGGIGSGSSLMTAVLMFFKNARHSHVYPDYPTGLILAILERIPPWLLAGVFIGLAIGLLNIVFSYPQQATAEAPYS